MADGEIREQTRLGGTSQCDSPRQIQMFGSIQTTVNISDFVPLTTVREATEQIPCFYNEPTERLWRVRVSGAELQRFSAGAVLPLTRSQILGPATPATTSRGGSVTYKLRVKVCSRSGNYQFFMDSGQPIEVYGNRIQVAVVGPVNAFEVSPDSVATLAGVLIDSILGISILAAETPIGQREVRLSQHIHVAAAARPAIAVPEHARSVKVYTGLGATAGWTRHIGDPTVFAEAIPAGTIDFAAGTSIDASNPVGDETHLRVDLDNANPRFFTIVWTIRP